MAKKLYTLYWRRRDSRNWIRGYREAYRKDTAVRVFQSALIHHAFRSDVEVELRAVKGRLDEKVIPVLPFQAVA